MAFAIISDLHSNLSALKAVFNDIDSFSKRTNVDGIYCLGDIIGYGCQPVEVLNLISQRVDCKNVVRGNHEEFYWGKLKEDVDSKALLMISYNKYLIEQDSFARDMMQSLFNTSAVYKMIKKGKFDIVLTHNGPAADYTNYRLPWHKEVLLPSLITEFRQVQDGKKPTSIFHRKIQHLYFFGHTHFPTIYCYNRQNGVGYEIKPKDEVSLVEECGDAEYILLNPGSVGYSRDGNPHASYMIIDDKREMLYHRRVDYSFDPEGYKAAKVWLKENYSELSKVQIEDLVDKVHQTARHGVFGANVATLPDDSWRKYYKVNL